MNSKQILVESAKKIDIDLSPSMINSFMSYLELIMIWGQKINLTSVLKEQNIIIKHFIDSLTISSYIKDNSHILDIGTGAGFPGIPLLIQNNSLELSLMESTTKKVSFLKEVKRSLRLENLHIYNIRAENVIDELKNRFDYVIFRAVGDFEKIVKLARPYLKKNGKIIIMKGPKGVAEFKRYINKNPDIIELIEIKEIELPILKNKRILIILKYI
ncbi:MAG: 16S rRNA (guanine(527)-N(7))-methyltransferase RsmG [Candidatus Dadabacteria bacterium]|nr:16S rRNA (guanine(527)-N(7))-methyltransferase RsmG [Candidatus Dadabacteria bacterium]NIQ12992.1 16S rRNA (guanine(527)-N(7))-methyltransferase RsmG [Candidatus Dadabacteria bacterium]